MRILLNPDSGVPLYLQLADGLREGISAGAQGAGEELPSVRALGAELRVNYHTVARAYRLLEDEGLLARQRGGPYRVAAGADRSAALSLLTDEIRGLCRRADLLKLRDEELLGLIQDVLSSRRAAAS